MDGSIERIRNRWNEWSETWYLKHRTDEAISKIISRPETAFHPAVYSIIREAFPDLRGKRICVPSSGDNHAVFAFHLMGAQVISCDISERQLENSADIARRHGWEIAFHCDDTMRLNTIGSGEFDFVYTSNGVHVWIPDLHAMYSSIHRILKRGGVYIMFDIHPFMRPFASESGAMTVVKPYEATGPFGDVPTYHWRMQDIMNAVISAGLNVKHIEEMAAEDGTFWIDDSSDDEESRSQQELERLCDWRLYPLAALPQWLAVYASK